MSSTAAQPSTTSTTTPAPVAAKPAAPAADAGKAAPPADAAAKPGDPAAAPAAAGSEAAKKPEPDLRKQFAALAREEAKLQQMRGELKRESAELEQFRELKKLAETDKYAMVEKLGLDVNTWAKRHLNGGKETTEERLARLENERKEELRQRQDGERQAASQRQAAAEAKARTDVIADLGKFVQDAGERYEYIKTRDAAEVVYETMDAHYRRTGRILEYEEACDLVEQHFEEDALKLTGVSKFKTKLAAQAAPTAEAAAGAAKQTTASATKAKQAPVTNNLASTAPDRVPATLTLEERKKRFRARLRGE